MSKFGVKQFQKLNGLKMMFSLCVMLCAMDLIHAVAVPLVGKELKFALDYHNDMRRGEKAGNMMKMKWSTTLASESAAWARRCNFKHQMKGRGENLAFNSNPGSVHKRIKDAMDAWFSEKKLFSWSSNSCWSACHYTQIVWANTTQVGCAAERCGYLNAGGSMVKNAFYYVCFYTPRGNFGNKVYKGGPPCSKCPTGAKCERGLCVGGSGGGGGGGGGSGVCKDDHNTNACKAWASRGECNKNPRWMKVHCKKSCKVCR